VTGAARLYREATGHPRFEATGRKQRSKQPDTLALRRYRDAHALPATPSARRSVSIRRKQPDTHAKAPALPRHRANT